jgi:hypothetical protein
MGHRSSLFGLQTPTALECRQLETCTPIGDAKNFVPLLDEQPYAEVVASRVEAVANLKQFASGLCTHDELRKRIPSLVAALEKSIAPFVAVQLDLYDFSFLIDEYRSEFDAWFDYIEGVATGKIAHRNILEDPLAGIVFEVGGIFVPELETQFGGQTNLDYVLSGLLTFYTR